VRRKGLTHHPAAGNRAGGNNPKGRTMTTYRLFKIQDPRSPGFFWYEIEGRTTSGETFTAAVCDTREEAREHIKSMREAVK
jgi:hypothetical protein